jgi:hypothetical protein
MILLIWEHGMRKVLRGYAKDKDGNLILIGAMPVPHSKDKSSPRERKDKRHLVKRGATIFKKETPSAMQTIVQETTFSVDEVRGLAP